MSAQFIFAFSAFLIFIATLIFRKGGVESIHEHHCVRCIKTWTCHDGNQCQYSNECYCTQCQNELLQEMSTLS